MTISQKRALERAMFSPSNGGTRPRLFCGDAMNESRHLTAAKAVAQATGHKQRGPVWIIRPAPQPDSKRRPQ